MSAGIGMEDRFCRIINDFCTALAIFVVSVKDPTVISIELIKGKKYKTNKFDEFVRDVEILNGLMSKTTEKIKNIIISLNSLFVKKDISDLLSFLENSRQLLVFLVREDIFIKLTILKDSFELMNINNKKLIERVDRICNTIISIFDLTVTITVIFIPNLSFLSIVSTALSKFSKNIIEKKKNKYDRMDIDIDSIINKLLSIQIKVQIIEGIDYKTTRDCLLDKEAEDIIVLMNKLEDDYKSIQLSLFQLEIEISKYRQKRKPFFCIFNILSFNQNI